jgi:hypothetical protein
MPTHSVLQHPYQPVMPSLYTRRAFFDPDHVMLRTIYKFHLAYPRAKPGLCAAGVSLSTIFETL